MPVTKQMWVSAIALIAAVIFFGVTKTDIWIQNHFFDPVSHQWILSRDNRILSFIFYDGIKRLLIIVNVLIVLGLIVWWKRPFLVHYRRGLVIVVLSSILVPVVVGSFKATTNIPCPKNLVLYGGEYPHTCVWEKYPSTFCNKARIKCWPAGHASGGFALLSLYYLFRTRKAKIRAVSGALVLGWSMGIYKMLIGDHFLSHTVITMIMAWLIISAIVAVLGRLERKGVIRL